VVNIACGSRTTLNQLWKYIATYTGSSSTPVYRAERQGDVKHSQASIAKANKLIGYQPTIGVEEGLHATIQWYASELTASEKSITEGGC
jgi:nucleoside-diphosphate-sugar epimerase